jgi:hypothetical protein
MWDARAIGWSESEAEGKGPEDTPEKMRQGHGGKSLAKTVKGGRCVRGGKRAAERYRIVKKEAKGYG